MNWDATASLWFAFVIIATLFTLAFTTGQAAWRVTVPIFLAAMAVGWVMGIFISPYDDFERNDFVKYGKAVSVFVTGYAAAKVELMIQRLGDYSFLAKDVNVLRICGAFVLVVAVTIVVFTSRRYSVDKRRHSAVAQGIGPSTIEGIVKTPEATPTPSVDGDATRSSGSRPKDHATDLADDAADEQSGFA